MLQQSMTFLLLFYFAQSEASDRPYQIRSYNYPSYNFGFNTDGGAAITTTEETFHIVSPGLMGEPGTVSFESVRYPGRYLRHRNWVLHLDTFKEGNHLLYKKDATFYPHQGKFFHGYTSYESFNFPNYFIRHQNYILRISQLTNPPTDLFKMDASFLESEDQSSILKTPPTSLISSNFPQRSIGFLGGSLPGIVDHDKERFRLVSPGLNGQRDTVSLESERFPGYYLRHRGFLIHLDGFEERSVFFHDATFRLRDGIFQEGSVSFESFNSPYRYIRHQGYRLKLHTYDNTPLFKKDASFFQHSGSVHFRREGPYHFVSKSFGDYTMGLDNTGIPHIINAGEDEFFVVRPGLTGAEGTVSLASARFPGHYLRHRNYLLHLDPYEENDLYKPDATFLLHRNLHYQGYCALESTNIKDYFIRHQHYRLKISKRDGSELFRLDSSFMMEH